MKIKPIIKYLAIYILSLYARLKLKLGRNYLVVLMYHRVLPLGHPHLRLTQPGMYVTPETLDLHIKTLKKYGEIVSLNQYLNAIKSGEKVPSHAIVITFDDGWFDNYKFGLPVLEANKAKATIYLTSDMIGTNKWFWPERVAFLFEYVNVNDVSGKLSRGSIEWLESLHFYSNEGVCKSNLECVDVVINKAKKYSDDKINKWLDRIFSELGIEKGNERMLLKWEEYKCMRDSGLVEAGSHTKNHMRLIDGLDEVTENDEIIMSKSDIAMHTGDNIASFCFPNGNYNSRVMKVVTTNYDSSVTTERGINYRPRTFHALKRIAMHESMTNTKIKFLSKLSCMI